MNELPNDEVLAKLAEDMHKGENAVDYWEVAACVSTCAQAAKRDRLRWTDTPPTEPGWYWVKASFEKSPRVAEVVSTHSAETPFDVYITPGGRPGLIEDFEWWAGPIEPPDLPSEGG